jgi:hypothetical protein
MLALSASYPKYQPSSGLKNAMNTIVANPSQATTSKMRLCSMAGF